MNFFNVLPTGKSFELFFLLFAVSVVAYGQEPLTKTEIKQFKKEVSQQTSQLKYLKGNFKQQAQLGMISEDTESEGEFFYAAPDQLKWSYQGDDAQRFIFKGKSGEILVKGHGQSHTVDVSSNKVLEKLSQLITRSLNGSILEDPDFEIRYAKQGAQYIAELVPKEKALRDFYNNVELVVHADTFLIARVTLTEPSEDRTTIEFQNLKVNHKIPDAEFE